MRRVALVVAAAYVGYLVLANVFLGFHVLDRIVTSDDGTVELRTRHAWSFWPGRASVRGFVLRLDNDDSQLRIVVERATASVSLWRLFRREVRLSSVESSGVSFRIRMRVDAVTPDNEKRVAAYPDIEGALGPPVAAAAKPVGPTPVDESWHVDLRDSDNRADEVWIQEYRLTGDIHAVGSFALWPGKSFVLRPSTAHVQGGVVRVGPHQITDDLQLESEPAEITEIALASTHGSDVLKSLTASAHGGSTLQDASFLDVYPHVPELRVQPSKSTFDARFVRGEFVRGTSGELVVPHGSFRTQGLALRGTVIVRLRVPDDGDLELGADSSASELELDALPSTKQEPWTLHETSARQILHAVLGEHAHLGLGSYHGEVRTPTLGWFEDLAKLGTKSRGHASVSYELQRDGEGNIHGPWKAHVDEGVLWSEHISATVTSTAHGHLSTKSNPAEGVTVSAVTVEAPHASVHAKRFEPRATWFRADVPSFTIASEPKFQLRATAELAAGNGNLVAGVVESEAGLVLGPIAAQLVQGDGMNVRVGVAVLEDEINVEVPSAEVGAVHAKGFWRRRRGHSLLVGLLQHAPLSVGVRIGEGVPLVVPAAPDSWFMAQGH